MLWAVSLGIFSLWLQVKGYSRSFSLGADILAISLTVITVVVGMAYQDPFRYSYRISMIYVTQTWVLALALMQVRVAFTMGRPLALYATAAATATIPYAFTKEVLPKFFGSSIRNPDTYVEISLLLSTLSILGAYLLTQRLLPLAKQWAISYRRYFLKALIRAAAIQFLCLAFLLFYVYLLKQSQYWSAKLIVLPLTFGMFGMYAVHRWITGTPPILEATETELSQVDITSSTASITSVTSPPPSQHQKLGRP